ncbi:hypothetical protein [Vibrio sp. TBV020]|uniref:hypothetical protein n=1 Tax=Vibrio sp. TBV020 TaxID=3137398 RepID=UPI0038CD47FA
MPSLIKNSHKLLALLLCVTLAAAIGFLVDGSDLSSSGYSFLMLPMRLAFYAAAYYYSPSKHKPVLIVLLFINEAFVALQHTGAIALW